MATWSRCYCNFLLNCPPNIQSAFIRSCTSWILSGGGGSLPVAQLNRAPLPTQPHHVEHPVTPIAAKTGSGASGWNAIDGYNDRNSVTVPIAQTILTISAAPPQTVTVDLGAVYTNLQILGYLPRQANYTGTAHTMTGNITLPIPYQSAELGYDELHAGRQRRMER